MLITGRELKKELTKRGAGNRIVLFKVENLLFSPAEMAVGKIPGIPREFLILQGVPVNQILTAMGGETKKPQSQSETPAPKQGGVGIAKGPGEKEEGKE